MDKNARTKAKEFLNEYHLDKVTLGDLRRIITSQGYTIVEFHHIFNDEHITALIEALDLGRMVESAKGFTYADRQRRLVFLHEGLSDNEKLLILAHEEGHIYCGHLSSAPVIGRDVLEEHEANEFTHYILKRRITERIGGFMKQRKWLFVAAVIVLICIVSLLILNAVRKEHSYCGEYYITVFGNKYHEQACIFVKGKTNVHRMTVDEYNSGDYEPCGICLPYTNTESGN